jgi:hypothetical protein
MSIWLDTYVISHMLLFKRRQVSCVTVVAIGVTWLIILGGGVQNRPWVLGTLIYEGVKLQRAGRLV